MTNFVFGASLDSFAAINLGADFDLDLLQCILKQFIDIFKVKLVETEKTIHRLQGECDKLLDMADDFYFGHNLYCRRSKLTGCEAELNQLRCDLEEFFRVLEKAGNRALIDLRGISNAAQTFGRVEKQFSSKYQLTCNQGETDPEPQPKTCGCKKGNLNNLKTDVRHFYPQLRHPYDAAKIQLDEFSGICSNLTVAIGAWNTKLT